MVKRDVGATWKQMMENGRQGAPIQCHRMDPDQTTLWTRISRVGETTNNKKDKSEHRRAESSYQQRRTYSQHARDSRADRSRHDLAVTWRGHTGFRFHTSSPDGAGGRLSRSQSQSLLRE